MNAQKNRIVEYAIAILIIAIVAIVSALPTINHFPAFTHAWAQTDWYSLSIGFQNNGFDFLHPETLIYNKQYPSYWQGDDGTTITSVDFPIHTYIVAIIMKLLGTQAPWVFRCWTFIVSFIGLWFLFLVCKRLTNNVLKSTLVVCLAITSPLYTYYFDGFLPSAPALAFVFIGLWAYVVYYQGNKLKYWHIAIAALTLATLIRTSQAVPLAAVCCFEIFQLIFNKDKKFNKIQVIPIILSAIAIGGYMWWNAQLRAENGSLFLNNLRPAENKEQIDSVFDIMNWNWKFRYFSKIQHWLVAASIIAAIAYSILKHKKIHSNSLVWLAIIYSFGTLLFFMAMFLQYHDHDYYFLDSFFAPILLIFILTLKQLPELKNYWKILPLVISILLLIIMFNAAKLDNRRRIDANDRALQCNINYEGSDKWLDSLNISRNAKILTLGAYPQNSPFIKMQRKGYAAMWTDKWLLDKVMQFDFDYVVIENSIIDSNNKDLNMAIEQLKCIDNNGKLKIYKRKTE